MSKFDRDWKTEEHDLKRAVGFAARPVLPGENQEAYERLVDDLWEQYEPEGPVEVDLVDSIADAIWRKKHIDVFHRAFEARVKWGAYFEYPGDPHGFLRIFRKNCQQLAAMFVHGTTIIATNIVESKLADAGEEDAKTTEDTSGNVENALDVSTEDTDCGKTLDKEASLNPTIDEIPEGMLKRVVDTALAEITADYTNAGAATGVKSLDDVISRVVKREFVAETEKSGDQKNCNGTFEKTADLYNKMIADVEAALGNAAAEELIKQIYCDETEHSLAQLGDLLTPECHGAELRHKELIDLSIERAHDRLKKYQAARAKKAVANIASLQPGWAARKR
jgi:hypothetical protein